jgi:hypothetical protein
MYFAAFDAVRTTEREVLSARAGSPVAEHRDRPARAFAFRRVASEQLHRIAHAIAPGGVALEPDLVSGQTTRC